jgi:hypothetical protein
VVLKQFYLTVWRTRRIWSATSRRASRRWSILQRDIDQHLAFAAAPPPHRARVLTHSTRGLIAGHLELRDRVAGAAILLSAPRHGPSTPSRRSTTATAWSSAACGWWRSKHGHTLPSQSRSSSTISI